MKNSYPKNVTVALRHFSIKKSCGRCVLGIQDIFSFKNAPTESKTVIKMRAYQVERHKKCKQWLRSKKRWAKTLMTQQFYASESNEKSIHFRKKDLSQWSKWIKTTSGVLPKDQTKLILSFSHDCTNYSRRLTRLRWHESSIYIVLDICLAGLRSLHSKLHCWQFCMVVFIDNTKRPVICAAIHCPSEQNE